MNSPTRISDMSDGDIGYVPPWFIRKYNFNGYSWLLFVMASADIEKQPLGTCTLKIEKLGNVVIANAPDVDSLHEVNELSPYTTWLQVMPEGWRSG